MADANDTENVRAGLTRNESLLRARTADNCRVYLAILRENKRLHKPKKTENIAVAFATMFKITVATRIIGIIYS